MARIVIQHLLLFLLPLILYAIYVAAMRRRAQVTGAVKPNWEDGPWFWLVVAGIVLSIGAFVFLGISGGASTNSDYIPPRIIDGKIVPGQTK
jgi:hypothetical protein